MCRLLFLIVLVSWCDSSTTIWAQNTAFQAVKRSTTRALVVGVSDYAQISDLDYAHRDAEVFADFLTTNSRQKVAPGNIRLLTNEQATMGTFEKAMKWLVAESQADDRVIIYFSGHGDVEKSEEGLMGFLLLHNSPPVDYPIGGACPIEYLDQTIATLTEEKKAQVVLITDACRSGKLAGSAIGGPRLINSVLFDRLEKIVKIMSCGSDQYSLEDELWGGGRGLFSYHLVNGLIGLADQDEDENIVLYEIEEYIRKKVRTDSRLLGKLQIPIVSGNPETKINRVDKGRLDALGEEEEMAMGAKPPTATVVSRTEEQADSAYLAVLKEMEQALAIGHLMFPAQGSAVRSYEVLNSFDDIDSIQFAAKNNLIAALQDEAQLALNAYVTAPARELANRWANDPRYRYYPAYLFKAAELAGPTDFFYRDLLARANYFKGVELRLQAERSKNTALLEQAFSYQEKSLEYKPKTAHVFNEMGALYAAKEECDQAISFFQRAHEEAPSWVLPLSNLAECYRDIEDYEAAELTAKLAIEKDSFLVLSQYNLGVIYLDQNRYDEAKSLFLKAIQLAPNYGDAYYNLGRVYYKQEDFSNAVANFSRCVQIKPRDAQAYMALGTAYRQMGGMDQARTAYKKCLQLNPMHLYGLYNLALLEHKSANHEAAITLFERYRTLEPNDPDVYYDLTCAHTLNGDYLKALATLTELLDRLAYKNIEALEEDSDLEALRPLQEYKDLIKQYFPDKK